MHLATFPGLMHLSRSWPADNIIPQHVCITPVFKPELSAFYTTPLTKQQNKTTLHSLHEHVTYCNSEAFASMLAEVVRLGCAEDMWRQLDVAEDVSIPGNNHEAL